MLHGGASDKADLWLIELDGREVVVKDFGHKRRWVRWIGRLQIARECRAYRRLAGVPGLPRFLGRMDALALVIERVEGEPLASKWSEHDAVSLLEQIEVTVRGMHAAGVVHLDLRASDNILVGPGGRAWILDLASAVYLRPGGLAHRLFFGWLRLTDESALLKWKHMMCPERLSDADRRFIERHGYWNKLWPAKRLRTARSKPRRKSR